MTRPFRFVGPPLLCGVLLLAPLCHAQTVHEPLAQSEALEFRAILDATLANAPESLESPVRQEQAEAYAAAGRSWVAGRPAIVWNYYDDGRLDDRGQREANYGLQLPLWRPGERADSRRYGESWQQQVGLWRASLELEMAGRVRTALADIAEAERLLATEREATATARELLTVTTRLFDAGSVPRLDVMQAENLLLEQERRELDAGAAVVDAEIRYETLTGLQVRPALPHAENRSELVDIGAQHPLLQYLQSEIALAEGAVRQSEIAAKGNPQLIVGTRRERGDRQTPYTDTVNIQLTVPFGGKSYVSSRTSEARRDKVDVEVQYRNTRRALEMALHDAEHELEITAAALPLAERQAALGAERLTLARSAFAQGELTLLQVLPTVQEARLAARELEVLRLRQQRLIAEFNQLVGVLP